MIENPYNWYLECINYAIKNKYSMDYGLFFIIDEKAPESIKQDYKKYLDLCINPFISMGLHLIEHNHIVGFLETDNPVEKEQIDIFNQLVKRGYIDNTVFSPKVIGLNRP